MAIHKKMNIILACSEIVPYAKTGGLADVSGALNQELNRLGHNCISIMPFYKVVQMTHPRNTKSIAKFSIKIGKKYYPSEIIEGVFPHQNNPIWFVKNDHFYNRLGLYGDDKGDYQDNAIRFIFFCKVILETIKVLDKHIDIIHCNDWQTALVPIFIKTIYSDEPTIKKISTLLTIHNLAYQGLFWKGYFNLLGIDDKYFSPKYLEFYNKINFLKAGILFADKINTVSKKYAEEIQTADYGCGLEGVLKERAKDLTGIINGIDYSIWNPEIDKLIERQYNNIDISGKAVCKKKLQIDLALPVKNEMPLIAFIGRLVEQKGIDLILDIFDKLMKKNVQF
ncbi:MAG: glycogen synthase GlgA, partial [Candidatus Cloacimonadota bacterium]